MPQIAFPPEWFNQFSDPYAVLGLSVAADDRRVLKRYHTIAKCLHPDRFTQTHPIDRECANQLLTRLVNPAYQVLKQGKSRAEKVALLRLRAKRLHQSVLSLPSSDVVQQLLKVSVQELDVFYEQAISRLAELQFQPLNQFETTTQQLAELNLLYLHLKVNASQLREKPTGIIAAQQAKPVQFAPSTVETAEIAVSYAQRHYHRAQDYAKKGTWSQVVIELRDAIRLESDRSEYHSLLAKAYFTQNLPGMAKVHFRQALKLNPNDALALQYATTLNLAPSALPSASGMNAQVSVRRGAAKKAGGLFSLFAKKQ